MEFKELKERQIIEKNVRLNNSYNQFGVLISKLKEKNIPEEIINKINNEIDIINSVSEDEKQLNKQIRRTQSSVINIIQKDLKLVTINHHRRTWLALGIATFGLPLGLVIGTTLGNMGLLSLGMPIGIAIGLAIGSAMDKKALKEGKQIDLEIKY